MADALDLFDLAEALLLDVVAAIDTLLTLPADPSFPALEGAPERQFVSPGVPVSDFVGEDCCSQVAVWATPTVEADTTPGGLDAGRRSARYAWINHVGLSAAVSRCIPTGTESVTSMLIPPSAESLTAAARQHLADGWALWNHLHNAVHAEHLLTLCDETFFDGLTPAIPTGGCAGWVVTMRVALGGYTEEFGT